MLERRPRRQSAQAERDELLTIVRKLVKLEERVERAASWDVIHLEAPAELSALIAEAKKWLKT